MSSTLQSNYSSPTEDKSKTEKECRPKQNGCSKSGTGPSCSRATNLSNPGAQQKRACLEEAKRACETRLKDCIRNCQKTNADEEEGISGGAQIKGTANGDASYSMRCAGGKFMERDGQNPVAANMYAQDVVVKGKGQPQSETLENQAKCAADCYDYAANICSTVQCYCGSFKCDSDLPNEGGFGIGGPEDDKPEDEYDLKEKSNKLVEVKFNTDSKYGDPIELIYTTADVAGNIIWISPLRSKIFQTVTTVKDKVTRTLTTTTKFIAYNTVDMAVALCAGEVDTILSISLDDIEVFGPSINAQTAVPFQILRGSEAQRVMAEHAYADGFGRVPAYRDVVVVLFPNFNINSITRFPKFTFRVARSAQTSTGFAESAVLSGRENAAVWTLFPEASRLVTETNDGLICINTDDMTQVWTGAPTNVIEITPQGRAITYDGTQVSVYEQGFDAVSGSYNARLNIAQSFYFRFVDSVINAGTYLLSEASDGDAYLEQIEEVTPSFPSDSVGVIALPNLDQKPHDVGILADILAEASAGAVTQRRSVFLFRQGRLTYDTIVVRELRMVGGPADKLVEDGLWYEYTLPEITFGSTFSLKNVLGGFFERGTSSFILFAKDNTRNFIVSWSPINGVNWVVNPTFVPDPWKYSCASYEAISTYYYVASDGNVYALDTQTGDITVAYTGWEPCSGRQFYDQYREHIIYEGANGKLIKAVLNQTVSNTETLRDVFEDILRRSGISPGSVDLTGLEAITVHGFRSGSFTFGSQLLQALSEVYLVQSSVDRQLRFTPKTTVGQITVDLNDVKEVPPVRRIVREVESSSATVNYFSRELNGEGAVQTVILDRAVDARLVPSRGVNYTWAVLESDEYMRRLAEIYAYVEEESGVSTAITLPPRYLAFTVGDIAEANIEGRVRKLSIGADNTIEIDILKDDLSKYGDLVELGGIPPLSVRVNTERIPTTLAAPTGIPSPAINPVLPFTAGFVSGATNTLGEFSPVTQISTNALEFEPVASSAVKNLSLPMIWGRLVTAPVLAGSSIFTTHVDAWLTIEFPETAFVDRILSKPSRFGEYPDYRTVNVTDYNMLIVGKELIQYGYAEAVPGFPRRVTFRNLLRGRHDTDRFITGHTANEICVLYEPESCNYQNVPLNALPFSESLITFSNDGHRISDLFVPDALIKPVAPGNMTRMDFLQSDIEIAGNSYAPSSKHVILFINARENTVNGFTDDSADLMGPNRAYFRELYLLRAPYNKEQFDANRYVGSADRSYVMMGRQGSLIVKLALDTTFNPPTLGRQTFIPKYYNRPEIAMTTNFGFYGFFQDTARFNSNTDWLTCVLINKTPYGESRAIFDFPPGRDYDTRPLPTFNTYPVEYT